MKKYSIPFLILPFLFSSCYDFFVQEVDLDQELGFEPKMVVNGIVNNEKELTVFVGKTISYLDDSDQGVIGLENARIRVYKDGALILENPNSVQHGIFNNDTVVNYPTQIIGELGSTYRIEVEDDEFSKQASATAHLMDTADFEIVEVVEGAYINDYTWGADTLDEWRVRLHDKPGNQAYILGLSNRNKDPWDGAYAYFQTRDPLFGEYAQTDPFYGSQFVAEGRYLTFDDDELDGQTFEFTILVPQGAWGGKPDRLIMNSMNKDLFHYLSLSQTQYWNQNNPFAEPVIINSNVENGLGVFGAQIVQFRDTP